MTFEEQLNSEKNPAIIKIGNYLKDRAEIDPSVKRTIKKDRIFFIKGKTKSSQTDFIKNYEIFFLL